MKFLFSVILCFLFWSPLFAQTTLVTDLITDALDEEGKFLWSKTSSVKRTNIGQNVLAIGMNVNGDENVKKYFTTGVVDKDSIRERIGLDFCEDNDDVNCISPELFQAFPADNIPAITSTTENGDARYWNLIGIPYILMTDNQYLEYPGSAKYYLNDGKKGLDILSGLFNIHFAGGVTTITYSNIAISEESINDGVPDIIVTQIGATANTFDQYYFSNRQGGVVGERYDVKFGDISRVFEGEFAFFKYWSTVDSDSLKYSQYHPVVSDPPNRDIRLLAFDWHDLGIDETNYQQVHSFNQMFNGASDVAFIAYNERSLRFISEISGKLFKVGLDGVSTESFPVDRIEKIELFLYEGEEISGGSDFPMYATLVNSFENTSYKFDKVYELVGQEKYKIVITIDNDNYSEKYYVVNNVNGTINNYIEVEFESNNTNAYNQNFYLGNFCLKNPKKVSVGGNSLPVAISTMDKRPPGWPNNIPNAFLVLDSKEKGFVIPRLDVNGISNVDLKEGMIVYDTVDKCIKLYDGEGWYCIERDCNE